MSCLRNLPGKITFAALVTLPLISWAGESAMEKAITGGARQLNADDIAGLIVGKAVTATLGEKQFSFYYSQDNILSGKLIGGDWADQGYYGITDDHRVCLSMTKDKGRLRCMSLVVMNGAVTKYNSAGEATFRLIEFREGNQL